MTDHWYYTHDGKNKIGPLTFAVLQQLAASGAVQPTHMVLNEGTGQWAQAKSIPDLFPATSADPLPEPPQAEKPKGFFQQLQEKVQGGWGQFASKLKDVGAALDPRAAGKQLQQKFASLGTLKGKTKAEIEAAVGPPRAVTPQAGGATILQWIAPGYHIILIFKDDVCEGVKHEAAV